MDNKKRLEEIKMRMRHMEEDLKEFHKLQLKWFEEIMNLSDIDRVDMAIEDMDEGFTKINKTVNGIKVNERENFDKLMNLAWSIKVNELVEEVFNN